MADTDTQVLPILCYTPEEMAKNQRDHEEMKTLIKKVKVNSSFQTIVDRLNFEIDWINSHHDYHKDHPMASVETSPDHFGNMCIQLGKSGIKRPSNMKDNEAYWENCLGSTRARVIKCLNRRINWVDIKDSTDRFELTDDHNPPVLLEDASFTDLIARLDFETTRAGRGTVADDPELFRDAVCELVDYSDKSTKVETDETCFWSMPELRKYWASLDRENKHSIVVELNNGASWL